MTTVIERLQYLCDTLPELLKAIPEGEFSHKPAPEKWSKKEIVGHLIDSATNNHQRFVRGQFENAPHIIYAQDEWVSSSRYQQMDMGHVILFWEAYNRHLLEVIKRIPAPDLQRPVKTNDPEPKMLQWLITDYVKHLEYHMGKVVVFDTDVLTY